MNWNVCFQCKTEMTIWFIEWWDDQFRRIPYKDKRSHSIMKQVTSLADNGSLLSCHDLLTAPGRRKQKKESLTAFTYLGMFYSPPSLGRLLYCRTSWRPQDQDLLILLDHSTPAYKWAEKMVIEEDWLQTSKQCSSVRKPVYLRHFLPPFVPKWKVRCRQWLSWSSLRPPALPAFACICE